MSPYDSDNTAATNQADSELGDAYEGADRIGSRYAFPLKLAAFYAAAIAVGYAIHLTAETVLVNLFAALIVYFTLLFAAITILAGVVFGLASMVQSNRRDS